MKSLHKLEKRLHELERKIRETKKRLPAHSAKPPVMMDLMDLEDEYDAVMKQLKKLSAELDKE